MSKITVIGDTSSGKTCFLYAMYNFIAQGYVEGFTMSAANDAQDSELQSMYELLENKSLGNDRFPSQAQIVNHTISHYSMVLRKSQTSRGLIILEDTLKDRVMVLRIL